MSHWESCSAGEGRSIRTKMKTLLVLLIAVTAQLAVAETPVGPENQAILAGDWTPTSDQTGKALKSIQKFLEAPQDVHKYQKEEIKKISANGSKYCVQFTGVYLKGRKIIRCNFFPAKRVEQRFPFWKKNQVVVCDGGFWFWNIDYDVEKETCLNFDSNGYA